MLDELGMARHDLGSTNNEFIDLYIMQ